MWRYTPGQPLNDAQEYYHGNEMYSHIAMCQIKMKATILTNKDYQGGKFDRKFFDLIFDEEKGRLFRKYTQCTLSDIDSAYFNERKSDHLPRLADCELYKFPPYLGAPKENMMGSDRPKFGSPEYRRQVRDPKAVLPRSPPLTPATPGEADQPNPAGGGAARGGAASEHLSKGQRLRRNRAARARRHRDDSQSPERDPAFDAPTGFSDPDSDDEEVPRQQVEECRGHRTQTGARGGKNRRSGRRSSQTGARSGKRKRSRSRSRGRSFILRIRRSGAQSRPKVSGSGATICT